MKKESSKKLGRGSLRFKLMAVFFLALFLLVGNNLYFNYWKEIDRDFEEVGNNFSLIAGLLENDITRWLNSRELEIITMAENPMVVQQMSRILGGHPNSLQDGEALENYWRRIQKQYLIYDEIFFADQSGTILLSTDPGRKNTLRRQDSIISEPLKTGGVYFQDAYLSQNTNKPSIAFSVPVVNKNVDGSIAGYAGVLVYRIDIGAVLEPLLESRVNLGHTGEVILIDRNRTVITDLRDLPGTALRYTLETEPAFRVARGQKGIWRGPGYTGDEIIGVYHYIGKTGWGVIIRQEVGEILGSLQVQLLKSLVLNICAVTFIMGLLYMLANRIIKPVTAMAEVAGDISRGDFTRRVEIKNSDEIGVLGEALNLMASEIGHQFNLQKNTQEVLKSLVSTLETDEMMKRGLHTVCRSFDFHVGAVFLLDPDNQVLVRKALYCPGDQLLEQSRVIKIGEGMEGLAAVTGKTGLLVDFPENTVYSVNWLGGSIMPGSIVQVPLVFGTEVLGVMSLASVHRVGERDVMELETVGALMGVAINNSLSYERTRDLSVRLQQLNEQLAQQNEELNSQGEELVSQTEELQSQSEELQATARELQAKNTELERLGEIRLKFMATLSHELRAPLSAVISFSDVLLDRVVGQLNPQQEKYLNEIFNSGQHLLNLINDLLDLSKIEIGRVELNIRIIDPYGPLEEALSMVGAEVSRKNLQVDCLVSSGTYAVSADGDRLKQVFVNLLTNAVKFTPGGGRITIGARSSGERLLLWVADTGIGIPGEYLQEVFEEFKQAKNAVSGSFGGTGLGLSISKKLLELQDGYIYVDSKEGQGSAFTIDLPLNSERINSSAKPVECCVKCPKQGGCGKCALPRSTVYYMTKPLVKDNLLSYLNNIACRFTGITPTLLVVDDDPAVRSFVADILEPRGYTVLTAEDGQQGIERAFSHKPDIIMLDIAMPGADGFQVMDGLCRLNWPKGLSVLVCTSKDLSEEEKDFFDSRIRDILKSTVNTG